MNTSNPTPSPFSQRRSLHVEGVSHGSAPIPMGCRKDNLLYTSGVSGVDPASSKLAEGVAAQTRFAFQNLRSVLADGGATLDDVVRVTVYIKNNDARTHINEHWIDCFPDPASRPARHILVYDLNNNMQIQLEAVAVTNGQRP